MLSLTGDIGRMKRQQAFIASMINKVLSASTLSQPDEGGLLPRRGHPSSITVNEDLDDRRPGRPRLQFRRTGPAKIKFITVPFEEYEPDPNRLVWAPEAATLWQRIIADKPLGAKFVGGSISAADPVGTPSGGASASASASDDPAASGSPTGTGETPSAPSADESTAAEREAAAAQAAANGLCA